MKGTLGIHARQTAEGQVVITKVIPGAAAEKAGIKAGDLVREVAAVMGGKGGGRPDFAQAGGRDASKLDEAFARLEALVAEGGA